MYPSSTIDLGYRPREWQARCHRERRRFTVLATHRRAGKTELALMELVDAAIRFRLDLGLFFFVAPFLRQGKAIAWSRLKQKLEPLRLTEAIAINEAELLVTFRHNGAVIRILGADNSDALRGSRLDGVVVDEVGFVLPEVWFDILQPALSDRLGWAMFIGTPCGVNLFSELFFKAQELPDWLALRFTVDDTGALDPAEVQRLRSGGMPEQSFAREYLCDFSAAGDDQLISLTDVEVAARRSYPERDIVHAPRVLGVDPARFGDDRSVIVERQGLQMFPPIVCRGLDNMVLASRVADVVEEWKPAAVFVDSGAGAGVIDRLRQLRYDVVEVAFGGRAMRTELFVNRRAEMWWAMRDWIVSGGAIPNDPALKQELATPIYSYDAAGKKVLEGKDEIRKRLSGAGSPDIADALALTFAAPVAARDPVEALGARRHQRYYDYDPLEEFDRLQRADRPGP